MIKNQCGQYADRHQDDYKSFTTENLCKTIFGSRCRRYFIPADRAFEITPVQRMRNVFGLEFEMAMRAFNLHDAFHFLVTRYPTM